MKKRLLCGALVWAAACSPTSDYTQTEGGANNPAPKGKVHTFNFDDSPPGVLPAEFVHVLGEWRVRQEPSGRSLEQVGEFHGSDFPRVILKDIAFTNVHVKVRCSMREGDDDQACGLMWRLKNSDNYYLTRANALEGNVRLYKVIDGDRQEFDSKDIAVTAGDWHTLEAFMEGTHIRIVWDGQSIMDNNATEFQTGKVGLWTKADSVTSFDDFEATEL
jgi:hypothetical protein